jgi:NADH-quinone oxidoreductase subunit L
MNMLLLLVAFPLLSFFGLMSLGHVLRRGMLAVLAVGGIVSAGIVALLLFFTASPDLSLRYEYFTLINNLPGLEPVIFALRLDTLSLTMCLVVTIVSSLIAIYSWEYMNEEIGLTRYFAAVNLFVAFMLLLVLADNLLVLFIGWEGVGLCSFLLIGFYFKEEAARRAALKAFITTRIGDVFLFLGILLSFIYFGTADITDLVDLVSINLPESAPLVTIMCFCFLLAAVGKSAQLPLQTWLADAMWGPTPVSALIHAATMVTAGVYLIARLSGIFAPSPIAQNAILIVGAATLLFSGLVACFQTDMKRVLAYSTMSQLGYMFLALGLGAYQAAIFHLATHAFFKALLFLSAGVIGHSLHTYDLRKMGGLRKHHPLLFALFLVGGVNLLGLPFLSAGFFSKEWIMSAAHEVQWAFGVGLLGAFFTGFYTWKMMVLAFFGSAHHPKKSIHMGLTMGVPLLVLAVSAVLIGWLETPKQLGDLHWMSNWLSESIAFQANPDVSLLMLFTPALLAVAGAILATWIYGKRRHIAQAEGREWLWFKNGGGFEVVYHWLILSPYSWLAQKLATDRLDQLTGALVGPLGRLAQGLHGLHAKSLPANISFLIIASLVVAGAAVII